MKKIFPLFILLILWNALIAQDAKTDQDTLKNPKVFISGFGGLMSETSILKKNISESLGVGGALMINNYFFIGAYGLTLVTYHSINDLVIPAEYVLDGKPEYYKGKPLRTNFSHAGVWIGGVFFPKKTVHLGISSRFGWGNIHLSDSVNNSYVDNVDYRLDYTNDKVFVITPQVELDIKATSWLKINIGLGYRFVTGISFDRYKEFRFNTPQLT
ncbi:MAG: hypothetical protein WC401_12020, partial [Bacteroidales bacterium]